ncbi:hypothetical protein QN277_007977 [Acacia crassicarpa]|uniref:Uncharacterized protein n=1 Tax=Acacia crassicarpa TaxID=499986 RepID=A0AAE1IPJ8_9FABA|nr:hypothetical protein QN277_007977 [Acacia crassicarpa]
MFLWHYCILQYLSFYDIFLVEVVYVTFVISGCCHVNGLVFGSEVLWQRQKAETSVEQFTWSSLSVMRH